MSTVIHKIDLVCRMLREAGNPEKFEGVHSTLMQAKGRIAHLEAQLAATETMRDRVAIQFLPGLMEQYGLENADKCVRRTFQWADAFLTGRNVEPAAPTEEQIAGQPAPGYVDVEHQHDIEDGWYAAKFPGDDHWTTGSWAELRTDIETAGLVGRWVGKTDHYRPEGLVSGDPRV